jgi:hypothetical protein
MINDNSNIESNPILLQAQAAILIQRRVRGNISRAQFQQSQAARLIQRRVRGNTSRAQFLLYLQALSDHRRLSAVQIQRGFRALRSRQQSTLLSFVPSMTTTNYEFPGFKVAVDLASPVLNTDGLSAGRLYKKENRPKEGSKEEKELLTDIKAIHYPKYKVMNVSLKDPEKLASNLSILDNLTYSEQLMIEFNMEDPFRICFPDSAVSLASLTMDPLTTKPIFKDLFVDH